jgi:hypothetical protein
MFPCGPPPAYIRSVATYVPPGIAPPVVRPWCQSLSDEGLFHFCPADDDRLAAIMAERRWPLKIGEWNEVADEMGRFTSRQLRDRWMNSLRPPLDQSEFTIAERWEALKKSLTSYGKWKNIAIHFGNGRTRSAAMIRNLVIHLTARLRRLGFIVTHEADFDLLPDVLFEWGHPPQDELQVILDQFRYQKKTEKETGVAVPFHDLVIAESWTISLNPGRPSLATASRTSRLVKSSKSSSRHFHCWFQILSPI